MRHLSAVADFQGETMSRKTTESVSRLQSQSMLNTSSQHGRRAKTVTLWTFEEILFITFAGG